MVRWTRQELAEAVLVQLRACGPQSAAEIKADLGLSKREVEAALYRLGGQGLVEYAHPTTSPLRYVARSADV